MKKAILVAMAVAGLVGTTTAMAAENNLYVLGGIGKTTGNSGQSSNDSALASVGGVGFTSSQNKPTVWKLQLGYQINQNFAVEGGYIASQNQTYTASGGNLAGPVTATGKVTGWNLNGVGILPVADQFSLLGKLGLATAKSSVTVVGPGGTAAGSGSKTDITYGLGAKYDFTKEVFVRFDVDSYKVGSSSASSRTTVWMLDLGYNF